MTRIRKTKTGTTEGTEEHGGGQQRRISNFGDLGNFGDFGNLL